MSATQDGKLSYTSNVAKMLKHPDRLAAMQQGRCWPVHVVFLPTTRCQLNCVHCCFKNREVGRDLDCDDLERILQLCAAGGTEGVEFTGGGDPTAWKLLPHALRMSSALGMHPAVITNGVAASSVDRDVWAMCDWIRISLNSLEYGREIEIEALPRQAVTVTGCLILHRGFLGDEGMARLAEIHAWAADQALPTRVACDTIDTPQDVAAELLLRARAFGPPFICDSHAYEPTPACLTAWWKPCIDWNGYLYPCPSIELAPEMNRQVPERFRLCHGTQMGTFYSNGIRDLGHRCSFCKYSRQNAFLADLLAPIEHTHHV